LRRVARSVMFAKPVGPRPGGPRPWTEPVVFPRAPLVSSPWSFSPARPPLGESRNPRFPTPPLAVVPESFSLKNIPRFGRGPRVVGRFRWGLPCSLPPSRATPARVAFGGPDSLFEPETVSPSTRFLPPCRPQLKRRPRPGGPPTRRGPQLVHRSQRCIPPSDSAPGPERGRPAEYRKLW